MSKNSTISMPVIRRLPRYYRFLYDLKINGVSRISSGELSKRMRLTASQIRQDLNCFGGFGQQGAGYDVHQLYEEIGRILGIPEPTKAILVGAGNLGKAVANHINFEARGFQLVGVFDDAPSLIGQDLHGHIIHPTTELKTICEQRKPTMAILCIPKEAAPTIVNRLLACGVKGFWNFSHYDINYDHPEAIVENVHMGDSLMTLSFLMNNQ